MRRGRRDLAEILVQAGANVGELQARGLTLLITAVMEADEAILEWLMARGAEVDERDGEGRTALHWAAAWRSFEKVEVLLKHDADVEVVDQHGDTPLHLAVQAGAVEVTELLLSFKPDLTRRNMRSLKPLGQLRPGLIPTMPNPATREQLRRLLTEAGAKE